ncbi:glycosyltransferase family 2 protein [Patescibacteria group bacterium]|nr:glycosyltransferase family 2 protein [Patescibacteria group bacterium]
MPVSLQPLVTFITVNYRMREHIRNLLKGMEEANVKFTYEYFLVDCSPEDGTAAMVRELYPWVNVLEPKMNLGFGKGNNLAIKQAKGEYIVLLNPDLVLFPGQLEAWLGWMEARPEVGISTPRTLNPDKTDQDTCYRFHTLKIPVYRRTFLGKLPWAKRAIADFLMKDLDRSKEQPIDWAQGSALCIRRSVFEQIGLFDERFFMYFEDADFCRRAWNAGSRVMYTPVAYVVHYHHRESRINRPWQVLTNRMTRLHIKSALKYFWKYRGQRLPTSRSRVA